MLAGGKHTIASGRKAAGVGKLLSPHQSACPLSHGFAVPAPPMGAPRALPRQCKKKPSPRGEGGRAPARSGVGGSVPTSVTASPCQLQLRAKSRLRRLRSARACGRSPQGEAFLPPQSRLRRDSSPDGGAICLPLGGGGRRPVGVCPLLGERVAERQRGRVWG